jgi:anti-anti-sigma factor
MTTTALPSVGEVPTLLAIDCLDAEDGVVRLVARGEVDLYTLGVLKAAVEEAWRPGPATVVVDLTRVTFCCVAGVGVLTAERSAAAVHGVDLVLVTRPGILRRLLRLADELGPVPIGSRPPPRGAAAHMRHP